MTICGDLAHKGCQRSANAVETVLGSARSRRIALCSLADVVENPLDKGVHRLLGQEVQCGLPRQDLPREQDLDESCEPDLRGAFGGMIVGRLGEGLDVVSE